MLYYSSVLDPVIVLVFCNYEGLVEGSFRKKMLWLSLRFSMALGSRISLCAVLLLDCFFELSGLEIVGIAYQC